MTVKISVSLPSGQDYWGSLWCSDIVFCRLLFLGVPLLSLSTFSPLTLPADHPVPASILPLPADHPVPASTLLLPADHPVPTSISQHSASQALLLPTRTSLPSPSQTGQTGSSETGSVTHGNGTILPNTSLTGVAGNVSVEGAASESSVEIDEYYHMKRNLVKIIVPVLVTVATILIISAIIVTVSVCICSNRK